MYHRFARLTSADKVLVGGREDAGDEIGEVCGIVVRVQELKEGPGAVCSQCLGEVLHLPFVEHEE